MNKSKLLILFKTNTHFNGIKDNKGDIHKITKRYCHKYDNVDSYFVIADEDVSEDISIINDEVYVKMKENNMESLLVKIAKAINYFKDGGYTHVLISNITTFINIPMMYKECSGNFSCKATSYIWYYKLKNISVPFPHGAGYLLNFKLAVQMCNIFTDKSYVLDNNIFTDKFRTTYPETDDIFFGYWMLMNGIQITHLPQLEFTAMSESYKKLYTHYRTRFIGDRNDEYKMHEKLYKYIYTDSDMQTPLKQLCLNMIVKNEEHNLPKLFASIHDIVDYYVICDTGSTDNTIDTIKREMDKYGIPGEIYIDYWTGFSHNRQLALNRAVGKAKYVLVIDGDETLEYKDKDFPNKLTHSGYNIVRKMGSLYHRLAIINIEDNNKFGWQWFGPVHEVLQSTKGNTDQNFKIELLDNVIMHSKTEGGRSIGLSDKEKYMKDADLLLAEIAKDPLDSRSVFYLAQSYKDSDELDLSIKWYLRRIELGGWDEEVYYSYLMVAELYRRQSKPFTEYEHLYLEAHSILPTRLEALYILTEWYRLEGKPHIAYLFGKVGSRIKKPDTGLFLETDMYDYKMFNTYSVVAFLVGDYADCVQFSRRLLREGRMPEDYKTVVENNLRLALEELDKLE